MKRVMQALLLAIILNKPAWAEHTRVKPTLESRDRQSPKLARFYIERGDIYYQLNEFERVIENYSALKLDILNPRLILAEAWACVRMGLMDEA